MPLIFIMGGIVLAELSILWCVNRGHTPDDLRR